MSPIVTRSQSTERDKPAKSSSKRSLSSPDLNPNKKPNPEKKQKQQQAKMSEHDINEIKSLIESSRTSLSEQIKCSHDNFESKFNEFATNINTEVSALKGTIDEFKSKVSTEFGSVNAQLSDHTKRIENTEDDIQRMKLLCDLRVTGFPAKEDENLREIFDKIAKEIGYAVTADTVIPTIQRIPFHNRATGVIVASATVMFHFTSQRQKQVFYSYYLGKMPLNPTNLGLTEANRITIGESLTRKNAQLFKKAQTYKKTGAIAQAYTEDGLVKIKFKKVKGEPIHLIRNEVTLEVLIAQNSMATANNVHPSNMQHNTAGNTGHAQNSVTSLDSTVSINDNAQGIDKMVVDESSQS